MKKPENNPKKRKGAALVVAILLAAIIGSAAIGVTAIAFRQVNIAETYDNGEAAYYAAESGLEQGLLWNKYYKDKELPQNITPADSVLMSQPKNVYRYSMATSSTQSLVTDNVFPPYSTSDRTQVYDLQEYYKQSYVGDDTNSDKIINGIDLAATSNSTYQITKDNSKTFLINSGDSNIYLYWRWVTGSCNNSPRALEVKLKDSTGNEHTALFTDTQCSRDIANSDRPDQIPGLGKTVFTPLTNSSLQAKMGITALTITDISLKPIGGANNGIYFGFTQGLAGQRNSSGLTTTINSTGYFAGTSRQITANIDRQTGTIMDIFNYVIYKGQ